MKYSFPLLSVVATLLAFHAPAQKAAIEGRVLGEGGTLPYATVSLTPSGKGVMADEAGRYRIEGIEPGTYRLMVSFVGFESQVKEVDLKADQRLALDAQLKSSSTLNEVVVTGTMQEVKRMDSPVPVEVYSPKFFCRNPTPSMLEAMQNVNGVRPQINCNVCNTGDIHINGLEGPYTMVLIDGMPIVGGLGSVYGLSGIPNSLVDRLEVVKGPASALYGSEAVGGLLNVVTRSASTASPLSVDVFGTSWGEVNADVSAVARWNKNVTTLTGVNYFNYANPIDNNGDGFTDLTLQDRISVFQKWRFGADDAKGLNLAGRFVYEDRWGGQMQWKPQHRGGSDVYGESVYTTRWEALGSYALPVKENVMISFSASDHLQNAAYGNSLYLAHQRIAFVQSHWTKKVSRHTMLAGAAWRYTTYDDNTPATEMAGVTAPDRNSLPGLFAQDEWMLNERHRLLGGFRLDHHSRHGLIPTPRVAWKWTMNATNTLRLNAGTGFRVVNLFTEEHAALTGARTVIVREELKPERSYNVNVNYVRRINPAGPWQLDLDLSAWHTHFTNRIIPDYETNSELIIYDNLDGHAVSRGVSANADAVIGKKLRGRVGATAMEVYTISLNSDGSTKRWRPLFTEKFSGTWSVSYAIPRFRLGVDYTGNVYSPMRLPLLGQLDPRSPQSPWWSIQNIQITHTSRNGRWEVYGGVKNLLNFTPPANSIARALDPFDSQVKYDANGAVVPSAENPNALSFDPSYVFAPNQGIRTFLGMRWRMDR